MSIPICILASFFLPDVVTFSYHIHSILMDLCRVPVPARSGGRRVKAKGFFKGAVVSRGKDWSWDDQDGGSLLRV